MACQTILVIDTGGTFSMAEVVNKDGKKCLDVASEKVVRARLESLVKTQFERTDTEGKPWRKRARQDVHYWYYEHLPNRIDSSAATPNEWHIIAKRIYEERNNYDGFVVIHGTDTLVYTSAALAFLLMNFVKPVIVTGAQIPVLNDHTDAASNFIGSLKFATWRHSIRHQEPLCGVFVYFNGKLMRGTTAVKVDSERWDAFDSPRVPLVGELKEGKATVYELFLNQKFDPDIDPENHPEKSLRPKLHYVADEEHYPLVIHLFPGINLAKFRLAEYKESAVVLAAYGCGNGPVLQYKVLCDYLDQGGLLAVVTECLSGQTSGAYAACIEKWDEKSRIAVCRNMTMSSAVAKAAVYLGKRKFMTKTDREWQEDFRREMRNSWAGEVTYDSEADCRN